MYIYIPIQNLAILSLVKYYDITKRKKTNKARQKAGNKGNNKITELRTILQRESQNP
jgi:hypothetical protein